MVKSWGPLSLVRRGTGYNLNSRPGVIESILTTSLLIALLTAVILILSSERSRVRLNSYLNASGHGEGDGGEKRIEIDGR